jgi:hypothetical protein
VLALEHDQEFLVGVGVVIVGIGAEIEGVDAAADGAISLGRIQGGGDGVFGFLPAIDHRHDDAHGAVVEHALDVVVPIAGDAGQGRAAGIRDRGEDVACGFPIDEAVLDIDVQPIQAGAGHEPGGDDAAQR